MGYATDPGAGRADAAQLAQAERVFAKIRRFGDRALADLPDHRALLQQIEAAGRVG